MTKEAKNPSDSRILKQYVLAQRGSGMVGIRPSLRSSLMFLERYWDVLRPGGRLITVIDDTILSSKKFDYVRDYIRKNFLIRAVISLPGDTFRRSGSRVKTSVLVLEKKRSVKDSQPSWFYFFSESLGVDDLTTKASDDDVMEAREAADAEADRLVSEYAKYLEGKSIPTMLGPELITDRLDLRNCVPLFGRMVRNWKQQGMEVKRLDVIVTPSSQLITPSDMPDKPFHLLKVSYDGKCEIEKTREGKRIRAKSMHCVRDGQIVFSTIRATDGAVGIVPREFDGALVSSTSYTVFDCDTTHDAAYLWSVLRSHELRADMQSLSPGSGRYTTYWPDVGELMIPWPSRSQRQKIGQGLLDLWEAERTLEQKRKNSLKHLEKLGVESEASLKRWTDSKAPQ